MKHTLSYNRLLWNVRAIAEAGLKPEQVPDDTFAIIDVTTDKTVAPATFDDLPKKFRLMHKVGGQVFFGPDCIEKKNIVWAKEKEYTEGKVNKWEGVITHCDCINTVKLNIFMEDELLNRAMGLPWGVSDFYVEVAPEEFKCFCACGETGAYANNVMTMLLYKNILKKESPFYTAKVETVDGATKFNSFEEVKKFVEANKEVNSNTDKADDGKLLKLIIEGKQHKRPRRFNPYNVCDVYPSGVKLLPSFELNGGIHANFTEVETLAFEVGNGYDLVVEEHNNKSYFTNVGSYARNMHLVEFPDYQFEENKNYDTLTLEFDTPKTLRAGEADMKRFMLLLGSEQALNAAVHQKLVKIFTPA